jgi:predicted phage tail protein
MTVQSISDPATLSTSPTPPAAPSTLAANAVSPTQVNLTWADNANNETGFDIQRCTGAGCTNFVRIDGVGANVTSYSDTTAAPSTTYSYRLVAFNLGGPSQPSNVATATTPSLGPVPASNLTATLQFGPTRVQLSWRDNSNNENLFQVWRSTNGGAFVQIATVNRSNGQRISTGGTVTYTNSNNLTNGSTYAYYVIAVNTVPNPDQASAPSNTASVLITLPLPPTAPTGLAGSAVRIQNNFFQDSVTLTWTDTANNETSFEIQRATNATFTQNTSSYTVSANTVTFQQNVSRTQNFYYRVRAVNAAGNSGWSNVLFVTTP